MNPLCKCSHPRSDHNPSRLEPCNTILHPLCGCLEFRLDPGSLLAADEAPREAS